MRPERSCAPGRWTCRACGRSDGPDLPRILAFESKAVADFPFWTQIAYREVELSPETRATLLEDARLLFRRLGGRDYARVDFRCDAERTPRLLEVTPNPAWCWDGKMNIMAGFGGHDYRDFLRMIAEVSRRCIEGASA